jgi:general secretion pathway protein C
VRNFRKCILLLGFLVYGVFFYLLVPPVFNAYYRGGPTLPPKDAGSALVKPVIQHPSSSLADYRAIWERNVFGTGKDEVLAKEPAALETRLADANLGFRLVGTVVLENSGKSLAIIDHEQTGQQEACWEGSRFGQIVIKRIFTDRVVIDSGKGEMILAMDPRSVDETILAKDSHGTGNFGSSSQLARLDRKEVAKVLPNYMSLVKTVRIRPHLEAGRPGGILIYNIDPEGLFGKIGLQDGDVIKAINGEPLTVTLDAVEIYNRLKQGGGITLAVQRGEEDMQLQFHVS